MRFKDGTVKGYDVFLNDKYLGFVMRQNRQIRLQVARDLIKSTHMGSWHKTAKGIEYATSIGLYLRFEPCKRVAGTISNYRIEGIQ